MISSNRRRVTPLCAVVGVAPAQIMALFCVLLFPLGSSSQQPSDQKAKQAPSGMGVATGAAHPAIKDSHSRPITAGGFVDGAPVVFRDITKQAGLDKFLHRSGSPDKKTILETMGSGVALLDYDNDGLLDLFVPGYVKFDIDHPPIAGQGIIPPNFCQFRGVSVMCGPRGLPGETDHLFHNNGDGTFTDVSIKAGVSDPNGYYGLAAVFVAGDAARWATLPVAKDPRPRHLYPHRAHGT